MSEGWVLPVLVMVLIFGLGANAWAMGQVYEGEASGNILTGRARIVPCANCSGGWKVGDLYQGSSLQFCGIRVPKPGYYEVHIDYISGDPRSAYIKVNNGSRQSMTFLVPATGRPLIRWFLFCILIRKKTRLPSQIRTGTHRI